ncbi:hypothetical protein CSO01_12570 [Cellulomonas soli]|uniref:Uncharacterized protein n=1 Tax=Cellulomonas soli TaxID=931535 RepID=A0A512PBQ0_9CELL|nr:hypothetical protein CSO01_12570 [Cellulomonas soli]
MRAHRAAIGFQPASLSTIGFHPRDGPGGVLLALLKTALHRRVVRGACQSQGPAERTPTHGELEAVRIGVQPRTPARHPTPFVHDQHGSSRAVGDGDDPQQG